MDNSKKLTLYGAPLSLYTGKARSYLIYKGAEFEEVFSSMSVYKKVIIPRTGVRFIPVVELPTGEFLQDTCVIIDKLEGLYPNRPVVPDSPKQRMFSYVMEAWADEWLLLPAMHYRWNKANFPFVYQEFGKIVAPAMPAFVRGMLGKLIGSKFKGFVPLLGINEQTIPAIEDWYENHVLQILNTHFASHKYLLGSAPSLGDFAMMGPLFAHLYRDPASGEIMKDLAPNVAKWVERMNQPYNGEGNWLEDDQIPDTLMPLLLRISKEFVPVLLETKDRVLEWSKDVPSGTVLPRRLPDVSFTMGDVQSKRPGQSFHMWKLQRLLSQITEEGSQFLQTIGASTLLDCDKEPVVTRENNVLVKL